MITWLIGENSFEIREALKAHEVSFDGDVERVDGATIHLADVPDLLMGVSLFATKRLVIISDITTNGAVWEKLPDWLGRINDDIHVIFVDTKPDKRTTGYKALKAAATIHEFTAWSDRDNARAVAWVEARAKQQGVSLGRGIAAHLVNRVGLDQWQLAHAITTLSLLDDITVDAINDVIPATLQENIFQLFETALQGNTTALSEKIATLTLQEDPYALFALLSSQALTLAAVTYADSDDTPVKEFAIHPFVASKLGGYGKRLGKAKVGHILERFAKTDADMKRSKAAPWVLIEKLLLEVAHS